MIRLMSVASCASVDDGAIAVAVKGLAVVLEGIGGWFVCRGW